MSLDGLCCVMCRACHLCPKLHPSACPTSLTASCAGSQRPTIGLSGALPPPTGPIITRGALAARASGATIHAAEVTAGAGVVAGGTASARHVTQHATGHEVAALQRASMVRAAMPTWTAAGNRAGAGAAVTGGQGISRTGGVAAGSAGSRSSHRTMPWTCCVNCWPGIVSATFLYSLPLFNLTFHSCCPDSAAVLHHLICATRNSDGAFRFSLPH